MSTPKRTRFTNDELDKLAQACGFFLAGEGFEDDEDGRQLAALESAQRKLWALIAAREARRSAGGAQ